MSSIIQLAPGTENITEGSLYRKELRPGAEPKIRVTFPRTRVTFIPKKGAAHLPQGSGEVKEEGCPSCGYPLDANGHCVACWGTLWNA
jgi:hypothetical protein